MHLFFFFFWISVWLGRFSRYGPSRLDFGRVGADFGRVGSIWESPRGTTQHGRAVCGVPPASPRRTRVRWPGSRIRASQPNSMIDSVEFFLLTVVFLQPFALFRVFLLSPSLWISFCVIYYGFCTTSSIHVWVRCWEFSCSLSPLLESSTLSCKATCLLFRHNLHINAVRELAGQHLIRR